MEISFCELRAKEVINICDGKRLGNIIDMVIETCSARVIGIVVPSERTFFNFFKSNPDIFIPFNRIRKIGKDVILVELNPATVSTLSNDEKAVSTQENKEEEPKIENTYPMDNQL